MNREEVARYHRVACVDQAEEWIEKQRKITEKYCTNKGYVVYKDYEDLGYSGMNNNRPGFEDMMSDMEAGLFSKIIIYDYQRLSVNSKEGEKICRKIKMHGCNIEITIPETSDEFFVRRLWWSRL